MGKFVLKVTIAGIDVTQYITDGFVEDSLSFEISKAGLTANQMIDFDVTLSVGQRVKIWRDYDNSITDGDLIFDGEITDTDNTSYEYKIICLDQLNVLKTKTVARIFLSTETEAGNISEIFKTLVNDYTDLTADATSVQDSGTAKILTQFRCYDAYIYERCKKLAQSLNWRFYYNPRTGKVHFEPIRYESNIHPIGALNLAKTPNWEEDKSELANAITIKGAMIETVTSQSFAGATTTVTLSNKPNSMKVTVGGALKVGGQQGDSGIDYYFDKETKTVTFLVSSSTIVVEYTFSSPLPLYATNSTSITSYGKSEKVITLLETASLTDMQSRLTTALNLYSLPFEIVKADVKNTAQDGYIVGQQVTITDPWTAQTGIFTIRKVVKQLRKYVDQIELGDKEFRLEGWLAFDMEYRIKKLEEEGSKDTSVVANLVQFSHTPNFRRKTMQTMLQRVNDSFILGHSVCGVLGRGMILDDFEVNSTSNWTGTNCTISEQNDI